MTSNAPAKILIKWSKKRMPVAGIVCSVYKAVYWGISIRGAFCHRGDKIMYGRKQANFEKADIRNSALICRHRR
ncbi:hypothetical protein A9Q81_14620 [Gammaproteobacteria bacterium 42_54_T18]|nr:hypothetical protein A9Q81_14620 [Gammaproteobacteria bacterium 42_54_T18]